jgi:hypothetical protein
VWHYNRRNLHSCFSEGKQLRRSSCFAFSPSVQGLCHSQPTDKHLRKSSWAASHLAYVQFSQASDNPLSTVLQAALRSMTLYASVSWFWTNNRQLVSVSL